MPRHGPFALQAPSFLANNQKRLTLGNSIDSGLNRVPLEGPPTRITAFVVWPEPPLGLLASDGGWRLMLTVRLCGESSKVRLQCVAIVEEEEDTGDPMCSGRTAVGPLKFNSAAPVPRQV